MTYNVDKRQLRPAEWFTTNKGTVTGTENTFASPGRMHVHFTPQPGIVYTTATVIGYMVIEYHLEFGFPTSNVDGTVPTRRAPEQSRDTSTVVYDSKLVRQWRNFAAGCLEALDLYQFLSLFDENGRLSRARAMKFDPDAEALRLRPSAQDYNRLLPLVIPEVGDPNPVRGADSDSDSRAFGPCDFASPLNWSTGVDEYDS
jgi:hypothetical protein